MVKSKIGSAHLTPDGLEAVNPSKPTSMPTLLPLGFFVIQSPSRFSPSAELKSVTPVYSRCVGLRRKVMLRRARAMTQTFRKNAEMKDQPLFPRTAWRPMPSIHSTHDNRHALTQATLWAYRVSRQEVYSKKRWSVNCSPCVSRVSTLSQSNIYMFDLLIPVLRSTGKFSLSSLVMAHRRSENPQPSITQYYLAVVPPDSALGS